MLIYDCFEFVPTTLEAFEADRDAGRDVCTESELRQVERLLKKTRRKRRAESRMGIHTDDIRARYRDETLPSGGEHDFSARWRHISKYKLYHLLNWVRFKNSRLLRVRFPLDSICGARLLVVAPDRSHANGLPAPKGDLNPSQLGDEGEGEDEETLRRRNFPGNFEECDDSLEHIGILILEFDQTGNLLNVDDSTCAFASTVLWPKDWRERRRLRLSVDWTPNDAFSKSRRHYIVGDVSEIKELANSLVDCNPKLEVLLRPNSVEADLYQKEASVDIRTVLDSYNTLSGSIDELKPCRAESMQTLQSRSAEEVLYTNGILQRKQTAEKIFETKEEVDSFFQRCGLSKTESINPCLKAGLLAGHLPVPIAFREATDASAYLDTVLLQRKCASVDCNRTITCTVRDALYQQTNGGDSEVDDVDDDSYSSYGDSDDSSDDSCDSSDDSDNSDTQKGDDLGTRNDIDPDALKGAGKCGRPECSRKFITGLCRGKPEFVGSSLHNHCTDCPDFGVCIGTQGSRHCSQCGKHTVRRQSGIHYCQYNRKVTNSNNPIDDQRSGASCWCGYLRDTSPSKLLYRARRKELSKNIREVILHIDVFISKDAQEYTKDIIDQGLETCFPGVAREDISCRMEGLEDKSVQELTEILSTLRAVASVAIESNEKGEDDAESSDENSNPRKRKNSQSDGEDYAAMHQSNVQGRRGT